MQVAVYEAFVRRKNGNTLHFDILIPEERHSQEFAIRAGKEYLIYRGEEGRTLTPAECGFIHYEQISVGIEALVMEKGYFALPFSDIPAFLPARPVRKQLVEFVRAYRPELRFKDLNEYSADELRRLAENI